MAKIIFLLFLGLLAVTESGSPQSEDALIAELKRILLEGDTNSGGDTQAQLEGENVKEDELSKEIAEGDEKENGDATGNIEGGELGETGEQNGVEGELENTGEVAEENPGEDEAPAVQGLVHQGWDMLDDLQRVSVALHMENHPITDNKSPRAALHDVLVQMFEFDGLTDRVINNILKRLSPSTDMCSQMFSEDEERTLERVTNCFIMRFTQVLSLVEHLEQVSSISELEAEDLIRLSTLERDLFKVSYEVFKILKREDPTASLPEIIGDKEAALAAIHEGDVGNSESNPGGSQQQTLQGDGGAGNGEQTGNGEEQQQEQTSGKRFLRKDLISRLARRLEDLVRERN